MRRVARAVLRLRPEEFLALLFLLPSALVTAKAYFALLGMNRAVPRRITNGFVRLGVTAAGMAGFAWFVNARPLWRQLGWLRDVAPFLFCIAVYTNLHDTIHFVNPNDVHDALIRIDQAMFGLQPCVWAQQFYTPWLTDLLSAAYMNYFLITVSVTLWLLIERRKVETREALFGTVLCFYFGYLLYILFPAAPPRLVLADQFVRDFSGGWLTQAQTGIIGLNPTSSRGAFPSLHCTITFISLMYAWKFRKLLFAILLVPGILLVVATVYLRHHYVIDIIAGLGLAISVYFAAPRLDAAWSRLRERFAAEPVTDAGAVESA